ncbi:daunorubicin resistance ABC transporter ATP-binding subunit [Methanocella conradii HZ254]|uniref:Daunorubicin resistance ABC transporter ATP-binding subunit n=1 Tax=Methanocella conradii (strain DSM 24694 / JCM 17849 / CGMCC 1.5162 / HZ254) TaxID=1041930 RepID=H8I7C0_METCZ|nr:ATP-binding cassette domain-containing protein [Methanocella conradii]AFD00786.1 daunorubicin resistance ABC transporter ATP-binding subunit [Methanocella conradii HZ254]
MTESHAIEVRGLTKKFGDFVAVDNVSFDVNEKEIFGFLGPNGAGKSTTIRMLCTLARPTAGEAKVAGYDLLKEPDKVRASIGLVSEKMIMYERLTAAENLRFFGNLYGMPKRRLEERIDELLKLVDMYRWKDAQIGTFSTGMKQRINVIRALLTEPKIIFMDEPTLGLDPQTTLSIRQIIRDINKNGTTVILTTHAMLEAETLSERVAIIDHGRIVALDTPANLKKLVKDAEMTVFSVRIPNLTPSLVEKVRKLDCVAALDQADAYDLKISAKGSEGLDQIIDTIRREGGNITMINTSEPTLEDVFLSVTGKAMRDQANEKPSMRRRHGPWAPRARAR